MWTGTWKTTSPAIKSMADQEKAALHGISVAQIAETAASMRCPETKAGLLHQPLEKEDVPIVLQPALGLTGRTSTGSKPSRSAAADGRLVPLSDLVTSRQTPMDRSIYHKNLMPVVYVIGDVAGAKESPVYAILEMRKKIDAIDLPEGYQIAQHTAALPESDRRFAMKWDGEWHITYEVFRDLGMAFAVVLVLIFVLVVGWFQSFSTPLVIMVAIPFSLIGILPAHWAHGRLFHRHLHDRLYRRRRHRGAQLHHPGGFHRTAPRSRACPWTRPSSMPARCASGP